MGDVGQTRPKRARSGLGVFEKFRAKSAKLGPESAEFWGEVDQIWPELRQIWPTNAQDGRARPKWPNFARFGALSRNPTSMQCHLLRSGTLRFRMLRYNFLDLVLVCGSTAHGASLANHVRLAGHGVSGTPRQLRRHASRMPSSRVNARAWVRNRWQPIWLKNGSFCGLGPQRPRKAAKVDRFRRNFG